MKMILKILIVVAIIIAIPFIVALFVKNDYQVQRDILINRSKQDVFNYVKLMKNQDYYNKWVMTDPQMKKEFRGTDGAVGFVYGWNGNDKAGEGELEITELSEGERIATELRFKRPFEAVGTTQMLTEAVGNDQTKVQWEMKGRSKYPMNLMNLFIDNLLGKDLETSLNNLKQILEKK